MWTLKVVGSKVPVHIVSYNSPDQETVGFLKSLAHAANTKLVLPTLYCLLTLSSNDSVIAPLSVPWQCFCNFLLYSADKY